MTDRTSTLGVNQFPFQLVPGEVLHNSAELGKYLAKEAQLQVVQKGLQGIDENNEFFVACLALLLGRLRLRLQEDNVPAQVIEALLDEVKRNLAATLELTIEELDLANLAVRDRVRSPLGYSPLVVAYKRACERPIRLLTPALSNSPTCEMIAAIARELQDIQGQDSPIALPVDDVRDLLGLRKLMISGAIKALLDEGLLKMVDARYRTGKARLFKFVGVEEKDYRAVSPGEGSSVG